MSKTLTTDTMPQTPEVIALRIVSGNDWENDFEMSTSAGMICVKEAVEVLEF